MSEPGLLAERFPWMNALQLNAYEFLMRNCLVTRWPDENGNRLLEIGYEVLMRCVYDDASGKCWKGDSYRTSLQLDPLAMVTRLAARLAMSVANPDEPVMVTTESGEQVEIHDFLSSQFYPQEIEEFYGQLDTFITMQDRHINNTPCTRYPYADYNNVQYLISMRSLIYDHVRRVR